MLETYTATAVLLYDDTWPPPPFRLQSRASTTGTRKNDWGLERTEEKVSFGSCELVVSGPQSPDLKFEHAVSA